MKDSKSPEVIRYESIIQDLKTMIHTKGRGYNVAKELNNEMWQDLGTEN